MPESHQEHEGHDYPRPEETHHREEEKGPSFSVGQVLNIVILVGLLATCVGQWFVYKDRQDNITTDVKNIKEDRAKRIEDYNLWLGEAKRQSEDQKKINERMEAHMGDKTIHVTEDQMKRLIGEQLQPMGLALKEIQVTIPQQQKQLDRIETVMNQILQNQQTVRAGAGAPAH